jgi:hypothetical protein
MDAPPSFQLGGFTKMSRFTAARPVAVGLIAAAVLVAGCTSKKSSSGSSSASTTPTTSVAASDSAAASPVASVSGDPAAVKLYQEAMASLAKVTSVHIKGAGSQEGENFTIDLSFANGKGATGSLGFGGGVIKVVAVKDAVYIQADAKAFSSFAGTDIPASALQAIAGKWLKVSSAEEASSSNPFAGFGTDFSNLTTFAQEFAPTGSLSLQPGTKTINGKSAVGLLDNGDTPEDQSVLYVEKDGDHLPLQIVPGPKAAASTASGGPATGNIDFTDYNKPVTVTVPSGAIDIAQLAALLGAPSGAPSS